VCGLVFVAFEFYPAFGVIGNFYYQRKQIVVKVVRFMDAEKEFFLGIVDRSFF
jgi:hypothetical protein